MVRGSERRPRRTGRSTAARATRSAAGRRRPCSSARAASTVDTSRSAPSTGSLVTFASRAVGCRVSCTPVRCEVLQLRGRGEPPRGFAVVGRGVLRSTALFGDAVPADRNQLDRARLAPRLQRTERYHQPAPPPLLLAEGVRAAAALPELASTYRSYGWVSDAARTGRSPVERRRAGRRRRRGQGGAPERLRRVRRRRARRRAHRRPGPNDDRCPPAAAPRRPGSRPAARVRGVRRDPSAATVRSVRPPTDPARRSPLATDTRARDAGRGARGRRRRVRVARRARGIGGSRGVASRPSRAARRGRRRGLRAPGARCDRSRCRRARAPAALGPARGARPRRRSARRRDRGRARARCGRRGRAAAQRRHRRRAARASGRARRRRRDRGAHGCSRCSFGPSNARCRSACSSRG